MIEALALFATLFFGLIAGYKSGKEILADHLWKTRKDPDYCRFCARVHRPHGLDPKPSWCPMTFSEWQGPAQP